MALSFFRKKIVDLPQVRAVSTNGQTRVYVEMPLLRDLHISPLAQKALLDIIRLATNPFPPIEVDMNTLRHIRTSLFIVACILAPLPQAAAQDSYTVAILPFDTNDKLDMDDLGQEFPLLLNAYMSQSDKLAFVERGQVDSALDELAIGISGTVDPASAAQIGYLTGAQVLVTGRIFPVQKDLFIVAKIIGVETGRVYGETPRSRCAATWTKAAQDLAERSQAASRPGATHWLPRYRPKKTSSNRYGRGQRQEAADRLGRD